MKKSIFSLLVPVCMIACSQESNVESVSGDVSEVPEVEYGTPLPYFFFGKDGSRYSRDAESGELVKKEMSRSELVVANELSFDSLKHAYRSRVNDEQGFEHPANYLCRNDLLAINTDYSKVVTEDGRVLLDDASLLDGCVEISKSGTKSLKKSYMVSEFDEYNIFTKNFLGICGISFIDSYPSEDSPTGFVYGGLSQLGVFAYDPVVGAYVPLKPKYARLMHVAFNKESCSYNGLTLNCSDKSYLSAHMTSSDYIETAGYDENWTSYEMVGDVAKHYVIYGRDTITLRTAINVSDYLAELVYNRYLANQF